MCLESEEQYLIVLHAFKSMKAPLIMDNIKVNE